MMKSILSALLASACALSFLTSCSAGSDSASSGAPATSSRGSSAQANPSEHAETSNTSSGSIQPLRIGWWGTQAVHEFTLELCDKFSEKTGIPLEPVYASWGDYWQKMNTLAAAGDLPDLIRQDYAVIQQYASKGLLEQLDGYVAAGELNMADTDPILLEGGRISGALYGVNIGSNAMCLLYDREMISQAGLQPPTPETTWENFEEFCLAFHHKTGKYGVALKNIVENMSIFEIYARSQGESLYAINDGKPVAGFTEQTLTTFFESIQRMHDAGAVPKIDTIAQETSGEDSMFAKGQAASDYSYTDMYATFVGVKGKQLGITILPGSGGSKGMYSKPSQFHSVAASSNKKKEAVQFIDAWVNDPDINAILKGRRGVPISARMAEEVASNLDETGKVTFDYMKLCAQFASPIDPPSPPGASEVSAEFKKQMEMLLFGESSPADAAKAFIQSANALLETANK